MKNEMLQMHYVNLTEFHKLRKEELEETDFDLFHLYDTVKSKLINLLLQNSQIFSKYYKTLSYTNEVIPQFKLLHDFPIQGISCF